MSKTWTFPTIPIIGIISLFCTLALLPPSCNATLHTIFREPHAKGQTHTVLKKTEIEDNPSVLGLNNIDKHGKHQPPVLATLTLPPGTVPRSTIRPLAVASAPRITFGYHLIHFKKIHKSNNQTQSGPDDSATPTQGHINDHVTDPNAQMEEKLRRVIELTVIICGITVVIVVLFLSIRISAHLYRRFKIYTAQRLASLTLTPEPSVHFTATPGNNCGDPGPVPSAPAPIYTVMPGHFLLQPCFSSSSNDPDEGASRRPVAGTSARNGQEPFRLLTGHIPPIRERCETPPPPYPGQEEEDKKPELY